MLKIRITNIIIFISVVICQIIIDALKRIAAVKIYYIYNCKSISKMKNLFFLILVLFSTSFLQASAQSDVKIRKNEFKKSKTGFKQAWDHVLAGDVAYMKKGSYYNIAFDNYIQAGIYNNSNPELNYKTGIAAIYTDHKEEAAAFFLKALETKNNVSDDILLYTGRALQYNGKYEEAVLKLTGYLKTKEKKSEVNINHAKKFLEECNSALVLTKDSLKIEIVNLGVNINSGDDDFAPVLGYDGKTIYFASQRKSKKSDNTTSGSRTDENIFVSKFSGDAWGIASPAGDDINTDYNESPVYIDSAGTKLYIYSGYENGGDIKVSVNKKGEWRTPETPPFNINTSGSESSVAFPAHKNEIWFVTSDGKDNLGEHDIYFIKKLGDKKWSKPQNAGPSINTQYDEQTISFSQTGDTLWFSSKGHNSIGGYDIFFSVRMADGTWSKATNGGYPLNTTWDDLFHSSSPGTGGYFYFASNRSGGFGGLDIYRGRILPVVIEKNSDTLTISIPESIQGADSVIVTPASDSTKTNPSESIVQKVPPFSGSSNESENIENDNKYFILKDKIISNF